MITNFETLTGRLSEKELSQVEPLIQVLKESKRPLKDYELRREIYLKDKFKEKLSSIKLRKIVNEIRSNSVAPIIATSKGYFLSEEQAEIEKQINSLDERAFAILNASNGLKAYAVEKFGTEIFAQ